MTAENRISYSVRAQAYRDLRKWGESISERERSRLRVERPDLSEVRIDALVRAAWAGVRGSMDE